MRAGARGMLRRPLRARPELLRHSDDVRCIGRSRVRILPLSADGISGHPRRTLAQSSRMPRPIGIVSAAVNLSPNGE